MSLYLKRLNHVGIPVKDVDLARSWFVDTLGLKESAHVQEKIFLDVGTGGASIVIHGSERGSEYGSERGTPESEYKPNVVHAPAHYGFEAVSRQSMYDLYAHLLDLGSSFICHPHERRGGYAMSFHDPCGHMVEIHCADEGANVRPKASTVARNAIKQNIGTTVR